MTGGYYTAIEIVKDYEWYLENLFSSLPMEYSVEEMSYSMWVISELLEQLEYCQPGDELSTMEKFSGKLEKYGHLNTQTKHMFSIMCEIVNNAIDLVYSY